MLNETQNNMSFTSAQSIFSWKETQHNFGEVIKKVHCICEIIFKFTVQI